VGSGVQCRRVRGKSWRGGCGWWWLLVILAVEVSPGLVQISSLVPPPPVLVEHRIEPESTLCPRVRCSIKQFVRRYRPLNWVEGAGEVWYALSARWRRRCRLVDGVEAWRREQNLRDGKEGGKGCGFEFLQLWCARWRG
jgi:hypothetical protein